MKKSFKKAGFWIIEKEVVWDDAVLDCTFLDPRLKPYFGKISRF